MVVKIPPAIKASIEKGPSRNEMNAICLLLNLALWFGIAEAEGAYWINGKSMLKYRDWYVVSI